MWAVNQTYQTKQPCSDSSFWMHIGGFGTSIECCISQQQLSKQTTTNDNDIGLHNLMQAPLSVVAHRIMNRATLWIVLHQCEDVCRCQSVDCAIAISSSFAFCNLIGSKNTTRIVIIATSRTAPLLFWYGFCGTNISPDRQRQWHNKNI